MKSEGATLTAPLPQETLGLGAGSSWKRSS